MPKVAITKPTVADIPIQSRGDGFRDVEGNKWFDTCFKTRKVLIELLNTNYKSLDPLFFLVHLLAYASLKAILVGQKEFNLSWIQELVASMVPKYNHSYTYDEYV